MSNPNKCKQLDSLPTFALGSGKGGRNEDDREELDFQFDEEAEVDFPAAKLNRFSEKVDDESDYELSDGEINKILIITPHRPKKHDG